MSRDTKDNDKLTNTPKPKSTPWHAMSTQQALEELGVTETGLGNEEVEQRRQRFGENRLDPPRGRTPLQRFLSQFHNVLIYVLIGAGVVTALLGHWLDSAVIFGVVVVNAIIGFIQEGKAERALDAIRGMLSPQALALRDGRRVTVDAVDLVPGDIVYLQSGDRVPADLRLLQLKGLQIDEAALTGESLAVEKSTDAVGAEAALGDRDCAAFSGTLVTHGTGAGLVVSTGGATELGRISAMLADVETLSTPLTKQMAVFGRWLTVAILAVAAFTFFLGTWVQGFTASEMFLAAVALGVAAIPEGLPAILTITLAIGVQHMAGRNAIIRRLPAVETLGSITVICSDKTGTLTRNEMTAQAVATSEGIVDIGGVGYAPRGGFQIDNSDVDPDDHRILMEMARGGLLCSDATIRQEGDQWLVDGDPTEGALATLAMKAGLDPTEVHRGHPRDDVIPFESEHRFMATLNHDHEGQRYILVKGAPEQLLEMCDRQMHEEGSRPLDAEFWHEQMDALAQRGFRVLALGTRGVDSEHSGLKFDDVRSGFVLVGLYGLADPPREEAIRAVERCRQAGIGVKMITGDHAGTARTIGDQIGLRSADVTLTGHDLDSFDEAELARQAMAVDVFARTSPEHKLRLVTALQAQGAVVAMTGDGVNDAPALKRADVGIAMGVKGTEAAKEAAEMVLADDNFASIAHAIEEGRTVYDNLKKAITFVLPTNGGQAMTILAAVALGYTLPLTPVQVLWVNMVTAVTLALALAFEPMEPGVMRRTPRRSDEAILSGFLIWRVAFVSVLLLGVTFGLFLWELDRGSSEELARTVAVNALVVGEIFYLFNTRFLTEPSLSRQGLFGSRAVLIAVAIVLVLQMLFTYAPPMQFVFRTEGLELVHWVLITAAGVVVMLLVELEKWAMRRRADFRGRIEAPH